MTTHLLLLALAATLGVVIAWTGRRRKGRLAAGLLLVALALMGLAGLALAP